VVFGYFLGALPFSVALAAAHGIDLTIEPDVHIALRRYAGWPHAAAAVVVDIAKGVFPVMIGFGFSLSVWAVAFAGVAAVAGQMWPPFRGHGEKGNSTGVGALIALLLMYESYVALLSLAFFALGGAVRLSSIRSTSGERQSPEHPLSLTLPVGMLLGFLAAPVLCWITGQPAGLTLGLFTILVAIVVRRLTAGLQEDLSVGARMGPVLLRRLLFDQSLSGRGW
jgi:glycerol-3-phosphate acyltransferase PlsY